MEGFQAGFFACFPAPAAVILNVDISKDAKGCAFFSLFSKSLNKGGGVVLAGTGVNFANGNFQSGGNFLQQFSGDAVKPGALLILPVGDE